MKNKWKAVVSLQMKMGKPDNSFWVLFILLCSTNRIHLEVQVGISIVMKKKKIKRT